MNLFDTAIIKGARFSDCRAYRYQLWRIWDEGRPYLNVIGLNPSTADETRDDPTIRRCIGYAKRWNYGGLFMTNIFAYRATLPAVMKKQVEPVGSDNDRWLIETAANAGFVLAAWGIHGKHQQRDAHVLQLLTNLHCLGTNDDGTPKHPLFLRKDLAPILYSS